MEGTGDKKGVSELKQETITGQQERRQVQEQDRSSNDGREKVHKARTEKGLDQAKSDKQVKLNEYEQDN
jgi:hypothetical protein